MNEFRGEAEGKKLEHQHFLVVKSNPSDNVALSMRSLSKTPLGWVPKNCPFGGCLKDFEV